MTIRNGLPPDMPNVVREQWHSAGRLTRHTVHTIPGETDNGVPLIAMALETDRFPFSEHGYHGIAATREELLGLAKGILDCLGE